ncbi:YCF48-related protein [Marinobacteraceae bacterium S3BR75-40.1]
MVKPSMLKTLGSACLCLGLAVGSGKALAATDVLETPAMETQLADDSLLLDIDDAGDRLVAAGTRGHIIYSEDRGQTWTQAQVPVSTLLTAIDFPTADTGWAVGHGGVVLRTTDGGTTWEKVFDGYRASELTISYLEDQIAELEQKIEEAPDNKKSDLEWKLEGLQFTLEDAQYDAEVGPWKPLLDVWFRDANHGFVIGAYGMIFHTKDGGETWTNWAGQIKNENRFHYNAIAQITGGALFIGGEAGTLYRSTDGGETWETLDSPYSGSFFGISGTGNVNEVVAFGLRGHVFRSTDLGRTWTSVSTPTESTLTGAAAGDNNRLVIVGNDGAVIVSNDAGESFRGQTREDRTSLLSVRILPNQDLLIVGEDGVVHAGPNGLTQ